MRESWHSCHFQNKSLHGARHFVSKILLQTNGFNSWIAAVDWSTNIRVAHHRSLVPPSTILSLMARVCVPCQGWMTSAFWMPGEKAKFDSEMRQTERVKVNETTVKSRPHRHLCTLFLSWRLTNWFFPESNLTQLETNSPSIDPAETTFSDFSWLTKSRIVYDLVVRGIFVIIHLSTP